MADALSPDQMSAMMGTGGAQPQTPQTNQNAQPEWLTAMMNSSLQPGQSAAVLGHSTGMMDNLLKGASAMLPGPQNNMDTGMATLHQIGNDFGAQNAGPVGADMTAHAPQQLQDAFKAQPTTPAGQTAATITKVADAALSPSGEIGAAKSSGLLSKIGDMTGVTDWLAKRADSKALQSTLDAVYSNPTGKKFTQTASQILNGQREITPASIFKEQGLTPDQQTVNLATRLKGLGLGKDPVANTKILANDMTQTEEKLQTALKGDTSVQYNADKPTLFSKLNEVKTNAPEEFRIKDSQTMVNKVVDFANKIATKSEDSIGGLRDGRISFDTQAKREFPTAFKPDGTIDTKTPAGYAIKTVRDSWNEHLYNTAPNGSEIQSLIGHEADLYRANQKAVEKAATGQGQHGLVQWAENNPKKAMIGGALLGGEVTKKIKDWTGIGF